MALPDLDNHFVRAGGHLGLCAIQWLPFVPGGSSYLSSVRRCGMRSSPDWRSRLFRSRMSIMSPAFSCHLRSRASRTDPCLPEALVPCASAPFPERGRRPCPDRLRGAPLEKLRRYGRRNGGSQSETCRQRSAPGPISPHTSFQAKSAALGRWTTQVYARMRAIEKNPTWVLSRCYWLACSCFQSARRAGDRLARGRGDCHGVLLGPTIIGRRTGRGGIACVTELFLGSPPCRSSARRIGRRWLLSWGPPCWRRTRSRACSLVLRCGQGDTHYCAQGSRVLLWVALLEQYQN